MYRCVIVISYDRRVPESPEPAHPASPGASRTCDAGREPQERRCRRGRCRRPGRRPPRSSACTPNLTPAEFKDKIKSHSGCLNGEPSERCSPIATGPTEPGRSHALCRYTKTAACSMTSSLDSGSRFRPRQESWRFTSRSSRHRYSRRPFGVLGGVEVNVLPG